LVPLARIDLSVPKFYSVPAFTLRHFDNDFWEALPILEFVKYRHTRVVRLS
jgi:hypothetical protein